MIIDVVADRPMRRWHCRLATALRASGHDVRLVAGRARKGLGLAAFAIGIERHATGATSPAFDVVACPVDPHARVARRPDLVIALDGVEPPADPRTLVPLFGGRAGDHALIASLLNGGSPSVCVDLVDAAGRCRLVTATLAIEDRQSMSRALDLVLARVVTLILQGVRRAGDAEPRVPPGRAASSSMSALRTEMSAFVHVSKSIVRKGHRRVLRAPRGPNHWRIGYRLAHGEETPGLRHQSCGDYAILPDDGARFFADPMPFAHEGRRHIFFEDFAYATGKGVIGHVEIDAEGVASPPRTVLEQSCHLSYPFVFEHGGEIYMLPEMSGARRVQLFRADPFPHRWTPDRVLLDGIVAADATPVRYQGRWWLFASVADDGGSSWDQLCLFHAPDLLGPWEAHVGNPVLVDAGSARPAGPMWCDGNVLMRVAQDCRRGYGDAVVICRVDRLDTSGYAQSVVDRLDPPVGSGAEGLHTYARVDGLDIIDLRYPPLGRRRGSAAPHAPARD